MGYTDAGPPQTPPKTMLCALRPSAVRHLAPVFYRENSKRSIPTTLCRSVMDSPSRSLPREASAGDASISVLEWQGWGPVSPLPTAVKQIAEDMKVLECKINAQMEFGGNGGKLQGDFGLMEDKKNKATYEALENAEKKFRFFAARQIACRLLGSRGYLCQKCWLAMEDCMCSKVKPCTLWHGIRFWLYMHPKDFLRQNNTGKLLCQIFGVHAATLCLYGIAEDEDIMWNEFERAGKSRVWCLYPNQNPALKLVQDAFCGESASNLECKELMENGERIMNVILIDGTWNNSSAMFKRLKERAKSVWGEEDVPCISLASGASAMHKLRPQPSWDRTCTAAAAINFLLELSLVPGFTSHSLEEQAEALEDALVVLLEALTARRIRMGRSITRKVRNTSNIC